MIVITGPQATPEDRGLLAELAGLHGANPYGAAVNWPLVSALYCVKGWESCPTAVADVSIAEALRVPTFPLSV